MAKNEALQREIDSMCHHDDREQLFRLVSKLDVEERARFGCRILEQAVSEMSREHANGQPHGWHGRTLEDVQAIRKSLLLQITEMANRDAAEVLQSKAPPQTPKSSNFVTSLQGQLSEAVAQHATRDPEWIKTDEHFSSAVADALDLKPFTEAALEMLEEVGIDDANKIRLKDLLRADQFDTHTTIVRSLFSLSLFRLFLLQDVCVFLFGPTSKCTHAQLELTTRILLLGSSHEKQNVRKPRRCVVRSAVGHGGVRIEIL